MLLIAVLPAAFVNTFGRMTNRLRESWLLLWAMVFLFSFGLFFCGAFEERGIPAVRHMLNESALTMPNMEGKEVRFGIGGSVLTAITTSNGATGSYNSMDDSYTPLGGGVLLGNMLLGEIVFGGLGTGLYSVVLIALIGLFLAGLMIGRTPEYLGKQIGITQIKFIMLYALASPVSILALTAIAVATHAGLSGLTTNDGPRSDFNLVCVHLVVRQQRPELRRPERQQRLLQPDNGHRHDGGSVWTRRSGARPRRILWLLRVVGPPLWEPCPLIL